MPEDDRIKQTSAYLRMLLLRPGEYRKRWERAAEHAAAETAIDYAAVARVLTSPHDISPDAVVTPAQVETARAALDGTALRDDTLGGFIDAFALNTRHGARLQGLLRGSPAVRVISGDLQQTPELNALGPPAHETLSLHELHVLGPDGAPAEHQTIQVIKSTVDELVSYPYRFDTDELAVEVIRGGSVGERIYRVGETLYGVDIVLTHPLARGETTLMQVHTTFFYRTPPAPEFRRGVLRTTEDVTIWVKFHPDRVPARVWSARWDRVDHARVVAREEVRLDDEHSVHLRYDAIERAIVGFTWEWT